MTVRRRALLPLPLSLLLLPLALCLAAGCGLFSRSKSSLYSLDRIGPATPAAASAPGVPVGIDTLVVPPDLERREVIVRKANHQLDVRSNEQWSAAFKTMVLHTLAFDLAARLPEGMVVLPGAAKPPAMRSLDVVFAELAAGPESQVVLDARWTLREDGIARHERIEVPIPSLASPDVATGVSQALATLSDRIAAQLAR